MKILIPSYERYEEPLTLMSIPRELHKITYIFVRDSQYDKYKNSGNFQEANLIKIGDKKGIIYARDWIWRNFMVKGERYFCMDDNVSGYQTVTKDKYNEQKIEIKDAKFVDVEFDRFYEAIKNDTIFADRFNINLIGTQVYDNALSSTKKYIHYGLIQHKCYAIKKSIYGYDTRVSIREEYDISAKAIICDSMVLRNNYLYAKRKHFASGGIGNYEKRLPGYLQDAKYFEKKYKGLIKINNKKKNVTYRDTEVRFTIHRPEKVQEFRKKYGNDIMNEDASYNKR